MANRNEFLFSVGIVATLLSAVSTQEAVSCEECNKVLVVAYDIIEFQKNEKNDARWKNSFASLEYEQAKGLIDSGLALGIPIEGVPLNIGAKFTADNFRTFQQHVGAGIEGKMFSKERIQIAKKSANPLVIKAWQNCMLNCNSKLGLTAKVTPIGTSDVVIEFQFRGLVGGAPPKITSHELINATFTNKNFSPNEKVIQGGENPALAIKLTREDEFKQSAMLINTSRGSYLAVAPAVRETITFLPHFVISTKRGAGGVDFDGPRIHRITALQMIRQSQGAHFKLAFADLAGRNPTIVSASLISVQPRSEAQFFKNVQVKARGGVAFLSFQEAMPELGNKQVGVDISCKLEVDRKPKSAK